MPTPPGHGRARVVVDDVLWNEDLATAGAKATRAAARARDELSRRGAPLAALRMAEGSTGPPVTQAAYARG
ncbi:MAG: hypothetical protein WKF96_16865 [Solirubrobacteraceae bacterium]